jgi:hypothetical protein
MPAGSSREPRFRRRRSLGNTISVTIEGSQHERARFRNFLRTQCTWTKFRCMVLTAQCAPRVHSHTLIRCEDLLNSLAPRRLASTRNGHECSKIKGNGRTCDIRAVASSGGYSGLGVEGDLLPGRIASAEFDTQSERIERDSYLNGVIFDKCVSDSNPNVSGSVGSGATPAGPDSETTGRRRPKRLTQIRSTGLSWFG